MVEEGLQGIVQSSASLLAERSDEEKAAAPL